MIGGIRRFFNMVFRRDHFRWVSHWGSRHDYSGEVGDGTGSSTVMAPVLWTATTFPEAPPCLWQKLDTGQEDPVREHPMLRLLERPNPFYTGPILWMATIADYKVNGNGYWIKEWNRAGTRPVRLWFTPSWMIEPRGSETDSGVFVDHYEYTVDGEQFRLDPKDVVHFRFGLDPTNPRKGFSSLKTVLREVYTDDEAARFTASLLRNMGVPGLIISPDTDSPISAQEAIDAKTYFSEQFSGDKRGEPIVMTGRTKVEQFGFSPEQLLLRELRRIPEERVTAVLGVPAIVAGLGAGLDRSTFCLPADARVWAPTGPTKIEDVHAGSVVWSFTDGRLEPRRVTYAGCTGTKPLLEIKTKNRTVRATGNHPFLVRVPGSMTQGANHERHPSYEWRRADELKHGDHVVQPKSLPDQGVVTLPDGQPATHDLLQFLGALVGDGTVTPVGVRMAMPPSDRCIGTYRDLALRLFTKQAHQSGGDRNAQKSVGRTQVVLQDRERDFGFSSALEAERLTLMGFGGRAHTKRIPSWVWTLSRDLRLSFLAGLVDTDGHIDKRGALTFCFCNQELTHDVRDLLVSVGIQASNVLHKTVPNSLPNPGLHDEYDAWLFTASSARQIAEIPFADPLYRERVEANADRHRSDGFDAAKAGLADHLGFYEVKSIRHLDAEPIYDLTVEGGHSFVADGVVVHNTNMAEAREAAYESGIIPTQRIIAEDIRFQLLTDFEPDVHPWRFGFDLSKVRVLQEDLYRQAQRNDLAYRGGWATRGEARRPMGLPVNDGDDVYQVPLNIALVPAKGGDAQTYAAPGNGNGAGAVAIAEEVIRAMERERLRTGVTP